MVGSSSTSDGRTGSDSLNISVQSSLDSLEDMSKAVVFFRKDRSECHPHKFTSEYLSEDMLGRGTYGDVYKVRCLVCRRNYARKVIRFAHKTLQAVRDKHIKDTDLELRCYMTLDHPHILDYVHHELNDTKMLIYTEHCQFGDLSALLREIKEPCGTDFAWQILEGLASALARCHSGLKASRKDCLVHEYTEFEPEWHPILHRDIKPGNVLLAACQQQDLFGPSEAYSGEFVTKLGDFGTSFKLEKGGKSPSTQRVGTRDFWAPEIVEEQKLMGCRITKWSAKSDIWGVGAVLHCILAGFVPPADQPTSIPERINLIRPQVSPEPGPFLDLLLHVVSECLDPLEDGRYRPSALQLLAVAIKSDTSHNGLRRSESFWQVLLTTGAENAALVTTHFVTKHLPLLANAQTVFSPKEIALIMAVVYLYCPHLIMTAHSRLCQSFQEDPRGGTAYHALTYLEAQDGGEEAVRLQLERLRWPFTKEMLPMAVRRNKSGLLPSNLAAWGGNIALCTRLTEIEEQSRLLISPLKSQRTQLEVHATAEFDTMFEMLAYSVQQSFNIPREHASAVVIETAERRYSNIFRKLVTLSVDLNVRGDRGQMPLHIFAHHGDCSMITFLLAQGAAIDAKDKQGRTPLHWAAWAGQADAVGVLLSRKAHKDATDREGRTALYGAAGGCYVDVVRLLLSRGADRSLAGGTNKETPLERAKKKMNKELMELLSS
ncbi:hypothetical protein LTR84_000592 [Exophiala bonariae]|uniref:non-specific serine/threonine protein kinase n=1 Tax=Exophiala bonariae TaxID=1690606 RepID=A0AAV9NV11_9EURO|nr:hypothetical protein LTR84_000592 [Exophiala bonariae]